jgi:hypothetical protein
MFIHILAHKLFLSQYFLFTNKIQQNSYLKCFLGGIVDFDTKLEKNLKLR